MISTALAISVLGISGFLVKEKFDIENMPQPLSIDQVQEIVNNWRPKLKGLLQALSTMLILYGFNWISPEISIDTIADFDILIGLLMEGLGIIGHIVARFKPQGAVIRSLPERLTSQAA